MQYKIGQILKTTADTEIEKALSGEKETIKKGTEIIIGADNLAHYIRSGMIQSLGDDAEVKGYDTEGISRFIVKYLDSQIDLHEVLEDRDMTMDEFAEEIEYALGEMGF
jgi:hypothetical protein